MTDQELQEIARNDDFDHECGWCLGSGDIGGDNCSGCDGTGKTIELRLLEEVKRLRAERKDPQGLVSDD